MTQLICMETLIFVPFYYDLKPSSDAILCFVSIACLNKQDFAFLPLLSFFFFLIGIHSMQG